MSEDNRSRYIVDAVDTALSVLELVSQNPGISLVGLSEQAQLNKSRTMRLLVTLEVHGLVRKDEAGNFHLGMGALKLGNRAKDQMQLLSVIQPVLDTLRDQTGETVQYRVLDGLQTLCLAKAESHFDIRVHTDTGRPRQLNIGSSKSILAFGKDTLLDELLQKPLTSYTENTPTTIDALQAQLLEIRARGFSISRGERIQGAIALGAPIFNKDGSVTSCLSLLGPEFRIEGSEERLGELLVKAADRVSDISREMLG